MPSNSSAQSDASGRNGNEPAKPECKRLLAPQDEVTESKASTYGSNPVDHGGGGDHDFFHQNGHSKWPPGRHGNGGDVTGKEKEKEEQELDLVEDGGWGWVVCFGSFVINFILDGTLFCFGILMLELVSDLDQDKYTTSWIGSAQMGIHMIMGPLISALLRKFTIRQVVCAGSILSSAAFIASVFAPNIYVLIFTYGVVGGIGFGMVFLPSLIVVVPYFNKRRAIATGIATSGSGLGTFAYAYIADALLEHFNWRGTVLILAGLLLHCLICGLLFRPLMSKGTSESVGTKKAENDKSFLMTKKVSQKHLDAYTCDPAAKVLFEYEKAPLCDRTVTQNGDATPTNIPLTQDVLNGHGDICVSDKLGDGKTDIQEKEIQGAQKRNLGSSMVGSGLEKKGMGVYDQTGCSGLAGGGGDGGGGRGGDGIVPVILKTPSHPLHLPESVQGFTPCADLYETNRSAVVDERRTSCKDETLKQLKPNAAVTTTSPPSKDSDAAAAAVDSSKSIDGGKIRQQVDTNCFTNNSNVNATDTTSASLSANNTNRDNNDDDTVSLILSPPNATTKSASHTAISASNYTNTTPTPSSASHTNISTSDNNTKPPVDLIPLSSAWHFKQSDASKFAASRLYQSADHIHRITQTQLPATNDDGRDTCTTSQNKLQQNHPNNHQQVLNVGHQLGHLSKTQAVSLYGINGYRNTHPHHGNNIHDRLDYHNNFGGSKSAMAEQIHKGFLNPILRKDIYYSGSVQHLSAYQHYGSMVSFLAAMTRRSSTESTDVITADEHKKKGNSCCLFFNRCFPLKLLKDKTFLLLLVTFTMWTAQSITMTYLPAYAVSLGIERSRAASLISIIGIANVLGRLMAGFITDCLPIKSIWLYFCALSTAALVNFFIPTFTSFYLLAFCSVIFGLCMAVAVSMRTIVLADQMGVEVLTESFGIVALFQGVAFIINPPIAGRMIDVFESSRPSFWLAAGMYTLSASSTLFVACLGRWQNQEKTVHEVKV